MRMGSELPAAGSWLEFALVLGRQERANCGALVLCIVKNLPRARSVPYTRLEDAQGL